MFDFALAILKCAFHLASLSIRIGGLQKTTALCAQVGLSKRGTKTTGKRKGAFGRESVLTRCGKMLLNFRDVEYRLYDNHHTRG